MNFDSFPRAEYCRQRISYIGIDPEAFLAVGRFMSYSDAQLYSMIMSSSDRDLEVFYQHGVAVRDYLNGS